MRQSQHTENEILRFLADAHAGHPLSDVCRSARISSRTFYRWRIRYGGVTSAAVREVKTLQLENSRLRSLVATLSTKMIVETETMRGAYEPQPGRQDHGCAIATSAPDTTAMAGKNPRGASLGRFAFVRGHR